MYWVFSCFQRIIVLNPKDGILAYMRELSPGVVIDGDGFVGKQ